MIPTQCPTKVPSTHVIGHTCHGLSQSRGIGTAPNHAPNMLHTLHKYAVVSNPFSGLCITITLNHVSVLVSRCIRSGPTAADANSMAKWNVSVVCCVNGAPNITARP